MRILFVHPSPLMYSEIYLRLEPLGMERVAAATRAAGHDVRIIDLQIFKHRDLFAELESFKPNAVGFSLNYLANVPEVIDLAKDVKRVLKDCFVFTGGHSGSFVADEILEHADGAIDAVIRDVCMGSRHRTHSRAKCSWLAGIGLRCPPTLASPPCPASLPPTFDRRRRGMSA